MARGQKEYKVNPWLVTKNDQIRKIKILYYASKRISTQADFCIKLLSPWKGDLISLGFVDEGRGEQKRHNAELKEEKANLFLKGIKNAQRK